MISIESLLALLEYFVGTVYSQEKEGEKRGAVMSFEAAHAVLHLIGQAVALWKNDPSLHPFYRQSKLSPYGGDLNTPTTRTMQKLVCLLLSLYQKVMSETERLERTARAERRNNNKKKKSATTPKSKNNIKVTKPTRVSSMGRTASSPIVLGKQPNHQESLHRTRTCFRDQLPGWLLTPAERKASTTKAAALEEERTRQQAQAQSLRGLLLKVLRLFVVVKTSQNWADRRLAEYLRTVMTRNDIKWREVLGAAIVRGDGEEYVDSDISLPYSEDMANPHTTVIAENEPELSSLERKPEVPRQPPTGVSDGRPSPPVATENGIVKQQHHAQEVVGKQNG